MSVRLACARWTPTSPPVARYRDERTGLQRALTGALSVTKAGASAEFGYLNGSFPFSGGPAGPAPFGYLAEHVPGGGATPCSTRRSQVRPAAPPWCGNTTRGDASNSESASATVLSRRIPLPSARHRVPGHPGREPRQLAQLSRHRLRRHVLGNSHLFQDYSQLNLAPPASRPVITCSTVTVVSP